MRKLPHIKKGPVIVVILLFLIAIVVMFLLKKKAGASGDQQSLSHKEEIARVVQKIKGTPSWYQAVRDEANKHNIPLDIQLVKEAAYHLGSRALSEILKHGQQ